MVELLIFEGYLNIELGELKSKNKQVTITSLTHNKSDI